MSSHELRLLRALGDLEHWISDGLQARHGVPTIARINTVPEADLAALMLQKLVERDRARLLLASMKAADREVSRDGTKSLGPRPKVRSG